MNFALTEEQQLSQQAIRSFLEDEVAPVISRFDDAEEFPLEIVKNLAKLGCLGVTTPEELGGAGLSTLDYAQIVEEIARIDGSLGLTICAHNGLCIAHIRLTGTEAQKQRYVPPLARGEVIGSWALTEPSSGSDASSMKTTAVRDGDDWRINGTKTFITNGTYAGTYVTKHH